jgi:hypothetical protein
MQRYEKFLIYANFGGELMVLYPMRIAQGRMEQAQAVAKMRQKCKRFAYIKKKQ